MRYDASPPSAQAETAPLHSPLLTGTEDARQRAVSSEGVIEVASSQKKGSALTLTTTHATSALKQKESLGGVGDLSSDNEGGDGDIQCPSFPSRQREAEAPRLRAPPFL